MSQIRAISQILSFESVWINAKIATSKLDEPHSVDIIQDGAVGVNNGRISWIGPTKNFPKQKVVSDTKVHDCMGSLVTPGLIDCHTHLVFGGNRSQEFELRLKGETYEQIARSGGGIASTVDSTKKLSSEDLEKLVYTRALGLVREGVTTIEIKTGYGLDFDQEIRLLEVINRISEAVPARIARTLLGLHALPSEYMEDREQFVNMVCEELLPSAVARGLIDMADAFCESIAFTPEECSRFFKKAKNLGLPIRIHADQLSDGGGAALAAEFSALSADHLEYASEEGVKAMARSGTVAVLLPGAFYYLKEKQMPPVDTFRKYGVPLVLATDANPGSSPMFSILSAMNMGCVLFGLTPEEAFIAVTRNAAFAVGLQDDVGTLEVGKIADMVLWDLEHPRELPYWIGVNPCREVIIRGNRIIFSGTDQWSCDSLDG